LNSGATCAPRFATGWGCDAPALTDVFVLNRPKRATGRALNNSVTYTLRGAVFGHDAAALPCDRIAWDDDSTCLRFGADSPMHTTTGDLHAMPAYCGQGGGLHHDVISAGERLRLMLSEVKNPFKDTGAVAAPKGRRT